MSEAATEFMPILSAAAEPAGTLVVSLHDVAPATRVECEEMLADLKDAGVRKTSLLVIPDYHGRGRSMADAPFVDWLHAREEEGHEIVLHGYYHRREQRGDETWSQRLITGVYTQGEGEFYDLSYDEALARIKRGREEFAAARFSPVGFIAPAWLLNAEGERATLAAEMEYTTRIDRVVDLRSGQSNAARSLVYSTRAPWRCTASLAWNSLLARAVENSPLVRLSLHPPDRAARPIWRQAMGLAKHFADTRRVATYREWIAEQRQP